MPPAKSLPESVWVYRCTHIAVGLRQSLPSKTQWYRTLPDRQFPRKGVFVLFTRSDAKEAEATWW